jgi:hypothetical protein
VDCRPCGRSDHPCSCNAVHVAATHYSDDTLKWTVIAAVLTGSASLIALIGLPFAIWQLAMVQLEQARIAQQLSAQPDIEIGLSTPGDRTRVRDEITLTYERMDAFVRVPLCAVNVGTRTAHNPHWTIIFPGWEFEVQPDPSLRQTTVDGNFQLSGEDTVLNPGSRRELSFIMQFGPGTPYVTKLRCECHSEDAGAIETTVSVRFEQRADAR